MQYLGLALYAEGPTDYYFLRPLLQRLCEDLCAREAIGPVDVSEVLSLDHPDEVDAAPREQRILAAAKLAQNSWTILFVHADGANDPKRIRKEQVEPSLELLRDSFKVVNEFKKFITYSYWKFLWTVFISSYNPLRLIYN